MTYALHELRTRGFQNALAAKNGSLKTKIGSDCRLDWIFLRDLSFADGKTPRLEISDHYPFIVRVADRVTPKGATSRMLERNAPLIARGDFGPSASPIRHFVKDLDLELAEGTGVVLPATR